MRLSQKTKDLMELMFMIGFDAFANVHRLHNALDYYGDWNHSSSYLRQMRSIREKGLLGQAEPNKKSWIPELTASGIDAIAERIDPERFWQEEWDGLWRTITFDIPANEPRDRQRLNTWLKTKRFGHLQGSLWLTARRYEDWNKQLAELEIDPKAVVFIEGKPLGQLSDQSIVQHSWSFEKINGLYDTYLGFVEATPPALDQDNPSISLVEWFRKESCLWRAAIDEDPLLPRELLPQDYRGERSWQTRKAAFQNWKRLLLS